MAKYDDLDRDSLIRLMQRRDAERQLGLVWERDDIEADAAVNADYVALALDAALSHGGAPWDNLIIEGDNFDALRALRMSHKGAIRCIYIDPPYNTGNRDFVYNDRFVDRNHRFRHSLWLEFMYQRLTLARELLADDGVIFVSIDDNELIRLETGVGLYRWGEGAGYYPDFVVCLNERPGSGIVRLEVKGDFLSGKESEVEKTTAVHPENGRVYMVGRKRGERDFTLLRDLGGKLQSAGVFSVEQLQFP